MSVSDRRAFLRLALAGVACACGGAACSASTGASPQTFGDVAAGNASDLAVGSIVPLQNAPAFLGRDAQGLYAMTTTCTHQGCDMRGQGRVSGDHITCRCHGSEFDANGAVLVGPASSPLQHYAVSVDARGDVTVHGGQEVSADARTPVRAS